MKISTFAKAPRGEGRRAFQDWFVEEFVRTVVRQAPTILGCVVRRVIPPPPGTPDAWIIDPGSDFFDFDVLMETWFPTEEDYRREVLGTDVTPWFSSKCD